MSGGYFDYYQYHIDDIADSIDEYVNGKDLTVYADDYTAEDYVRENESWLEDCEKEFIKKHNRTLPNKYHYSKETIKEFKKGIEIIKKAKIYAQRIDWLLSGDDGEESFHERLKEELEELKNEKRGKKESI